MPVASAHHSVAHRTPPHPYHASDADRFGSPVPLRHDPADSRHALEWSPATFIGFNSLSFDENLLRQALFQTLHPAYLTNTNGNARSDALRVAHAASVYTPDAMAIPADDHGRQVFRLDRLALANGHRHDDTHEAMADVVATMYMARLIRNRAPDIWKAMDRATTKNAVKDYVGDGIAILANGKLFWAPLFMGSSRSAARIPKMLDSSRCSTCFSTQTTIVASLPRIWSRS